MRDHGPIAITTWPQEISQSSRNTRSIVPLLPSILVTLPSRIVDPDALAKALRGYDEETINGITAYLPKRKQAMFSPIDQPIAKKEIRTSRADLVAIARQMVDSGQFSMDDIFK